MYSRKKTGICLQFHLIGQGWETTAEQESRRAAIQAEDHCHLPSPFLTNWAWPPPAVTQCLLFIPPFSPGHPPSSSLWLQWSTAATEIPQNAYSLLSLLKGGCSSQKSPISPLVGALHTYLPILVLQPHLTALESLSQPDLPSVVLLHDPLLPLCSGQGDFTLKQVYVVMCKLFVVVVTFSY